MKSRRRIRDDVHEEDPCVVQFRSTSTDSLITQPCHRYHASSSTVVWRPVVELVWWQRKPIDDVFTFDNSFNLDNSRLTVVVVYAVSDCASEDDSSIMHSLRQFLVHTFLYNWSVEIAVIVGDRVVFQRPGVTETTRSVWWISVLVWSRDVELTKQQDNHHQPQCTALHLPLVR